MENIKYGEKNVKIKILVVAQDEKSIYIRVGNITKKYNNKNQDWTRNSI